MSCLALYIRSVRSGFVTIRLKCDYQDETRHDETRCITVQSSASQINQSSAVQNNRTFQGTERDGICVTHLGACCEEHDDFALQVGLQEAEQDVKFLRQSHLRGKELSRSDGQVLCSEDVERK